MPSPRGSLTCLGRDRVAGRAAPESVGSPAHACAIRGDAPTLPRGVTGRRRSGARLYVTVLFDGRIGLITNIVIDMTSGLTSQSPR